MKCGLPLLTLVCLFLHYVSLNHQQRCWQACKPFGIKINLFVTIVHFSWDGEMSKWVSPIALECAIVFVYQYILQLFCVTCKDCDSRCHVITICFVLITTVTRAWSHNSHQYIILPHLSLLCLFLLEFLGFFFGTIFLNNGDEFPALRQVQLAFWHPGPDEWGGFPIAFLTDK